MIDKDFTTLFHVLSSEQQIIQRTDQKAFTLLSILGVFMVFFIVHFLKVHLDWFKFIMVIIYFVTALLAIINIVLVIVPRIRNDESDGNGNKYNPTFFGGISQFKSPTEYANYLSEISEDKEKVYALFANQVFALGKINAYKNKALKRSIIFFVLAIVSELLIIMSMAWARALPYLFPAG
ncbi:MAG: hypothetical protein GXO92_02365 [FCB group bacterium]|nr:hypothetical protein [FCB group bacterium]